MILSQKDSVMKYLIELPDLVSVLTEEETSLYEIQVRKMIIDNTLPVAADDNGDDVNIVKWYSHQSKKYLAVHKMPISVLSIFHGPKLESIFSAMGEVIDKKANRMCHPTYSVIQTVKYSMRTRCPNSSSFRSIQLFKRQDKHFTPVSTTLVNNMRNVCSLQKQTQCLKRKQVQDINIEFEKEMNYNKKTRKQVVEENGNNVKESRGKFQKILDKACKSKKVKSKESANDDKQIFNRCNLNCS